MKKRFFACLLLAVLLSFSLAAPASAFYEYGMIYDGSELLDSALLDSYGRTVLPKFADSYGAELRVDIITSGSDAEQNAKIYFDSFLYGAETGGNGAVLTLCVNAEGGNLSYVDGCIYAKGEQWLIDAAANVEAELASYLSAAAWQGDISSDNISCEAMLKGYFEGMSGYAQTQGAVNENAPEAGEEGYATYSGNPQAELGFVTDEVGLLDETTRAFLEARAAELSAQARCGVYMVIVDDYKYYQAQSIEAFSESIFTQYHMGWGDAQDGIVLVLSMAERDYDLMAYGEKAGSVFSDKSKDKLADEFLDNFGDDDWAGGFYDYVEYSAELLGVSMDVAALPENQQPAYEGPSAESSRSSFSVYSLLVIIGLPCLIAFAVCSVLKKQMRTAGKKYNAANYMTDAGLELDIRRDIFTHCTEHRELIHDDSDKRGGGHSSGSVNKSFGSFKSSGGGGGFSHKSGKF